MNYGMVYLDLVAPSFKQVELDLEVALARLSAFAFVGLTEQWHLTVRF